MTKKQIKSDMMVLFHLNLKVAEDIRLNKGRSTFVRRRIKLPNFKAIVSGLKSA